MSRTKLGVVGVAALLLLGACASLDVENPNDPDAARALASGEDVKSIAVSTVNSWYLSSTAEEPYLMLQVTCDCQTANFGNFGMRFNNLEPRAAYENSSAGGDRAVTESPWNNNYSTLGAANDVLRALAAGVQINNGAENDQWKAVAKFSQAASLYNLSILFDQAFVVDETYDPSTSAPPSLVPYTDVSAAALAGFDEVIALTNGKTWNYTNPVVLPVSTTTLDASTLGRIANTYAALTMRLMPRSNTELEAMPASWWDKILSYADKGISGNGLTSFDLTIAGDGGNQWYDLQKAYGALESWVRTDYRLVHRMDSQGGTANAVPIRYSGVADVRAPGYPATNDQRLGDGSPGHDYEYRAGVIGDPGRGIFMQSAYYHARYQDHNWFSNTALEAPVPLVLAAENDLLIAEALVKGSAPDLTRAAALVNKTHVGRGGLPAVPANASAILDAIDYERDVELLTTNGNSFMYARSSPVTSPLGSEADGLGGRLQDGTIRHLPIPAKELETLVLNVYTFGGVGKPVMMVEGANGKMIGLSRPARHPRPAERFFRPF